MVFAYTTFPYIYGLALPCLLSCLLHVYFSYTWMGVRSRWKGVRLLRICMFQVAGFNHQARFPRLNSSCMEMDKHASACGFTVLVREIYICSTHMASKDIHACDVAMHVHVQYMHPG